MCNPRLKRCDRSAGSRLGALLMFAVASLFFGCRTHPPLPPADLSAPGWRLQQGQAVWKPTRSRPALAGELILATMTNGDFFVQFSKTPFTLATAQVANGQWQIEFGNNKHRWSGRGELPSRLVWFQLPRTLTVGSLKTNWLFTQPSSDSWRLENPRTGEMLEGGFFP